MADRSPLRFLLNELGAPTRIAEFQSGDTLSGAHMPSALTKAMNEAPIVTLASASTVNIGAAAANTISISGTTTITAFDSIASGAVRRLVFQGALTLTHNSTSLILPGGVNKTTAAGDVATFVSLGAGNWRCVAYQNASGVGGGVFTGSFESSQQTITTGGLLTLAHGLAAAPKDVSLDLVCVTGENGWSAGDRILNVSPHQADGVANRINAVYADTTNVYVRFSAASTCFTMGNKGTGSNSSLTNANWRLVVRALV